MAIPSAAKTAVSNPVIKTAQKAASTGKQGLENATFKPSQDEYTGRKASDDKPEKAEKTGVWATIKRYTQSITNLILKPFRWLGKKLGLLSKTTKEQEVSSQSNKKLTPSNSQNVSERNIPEQEGKHSIPFSKEIQEGAIEGLSEEVGEKLIHQFSAGHYLPRHLDGSPGHHLPRNLDGSPAHDLLHPDPSAPGDFDWLEDLVDWIS